MKLILEFTEFNLMRMNDRPSVMSAHVDNPKLSINSFDRHEEILKQSIKKLNDLSGGRGTMHRNIKSLLSLGDQEIQSLNILRIVDNFSKYDVFLTFNIKDVEYWGAYRDILGNPEFTCENIGGDIIITKEWIIRLRGLIYNSIMDFLSPKRGKWKCLKGGILCSSNITGQQKIINEGDIIELIKANKNSILFEYGGDKYTMRGDNFIFFNWWFEEVNSI